MSAARALVAVVDDDPSVRESLIALLSELGFLVCSFATAEAFLASDCVGETNCLLLDVSLPGMTGPELQRELARSGFEIPLIFISAHAADDVSPYLLGPGTYQWLYKPFSEGALRDALAAALREPQG